MPGPMRYTSGPRLVSPIGRVRSIRTWRPLGIGRLIRCNPRGLASYEADKDLAMGCWEFARVLDHSVEGWVGQGRKIVRLPVVTEARGEQGVEGALPHHIRLGAYVFAKDFCEVPNGGNQFLALGRISSVEDSEHDDFFSVDFGG